MDGEALSRDLGKQVQDTTSLMSSGGGEPGQLEFRTLMGQHCLRVLIGVKGLPFGPLSYGYEPQVYGLDEQEDLRQAVATILFGQGLRYAGHDERHGRLASWLEYLSPSALLW